MWILVNPWRKRRPGKFGKKLDWWPGWGLLWGRPEYSFTEDGVYTGKRFTGSYMEAIGGQLEPEAEMFTAVRLLSAEELDTLTFPADRQLAAKAFTLYRKAE